jgi:lipid-A-disaccharide synthase
MAKWAKNKGFKVVYYIVPQVWAWHKSRVKLLKKYTDALLAILPFEEKFYQDHGCRVHFVGHPLLDEIQKPLPEKTDLPQFEIALLPGSRKQEVQHMLPVFLKAAESLGLSCVIAASSNLAPSFYEEIIRTANIKHSKVQVLYNAMYPILQNRPFAFVTSGTATLETALWNVPQIVAYKGSYLSYVIAKKLISLKYISLVNLILDRNLVPELIQENLTPEHLSETYLKMLPQKETMQDGYRELVQKLGSKGASERAAGIICEIAGKPAAI